LEKSKLCSLDIVNECNVNISTVNLISDCKGNESDVISDIMHEGFNNNEIRTYAQVTAHFVSFQKDGKKPDIERRQTEGKEKKKNVKSVQKNNVKNVQQNQGELCSINVVNECMLVGSKGHPVTDDQTKNMTSPLTFQEWKRETI